MQSVFARRAANARGNGPRVERLTGIAIALLLHVAAVSALLSYEPARSALVNAVPLMVSLITPPPVAPPKPPTPPKPLPMKLVRTPPRTVPPPTVLAASPEAPVTETAAPPPPIPVAPAPVEAAPAAIAAVPAPPPVPPAPPAPPPVVAPNFNAAYLNNPPPSYPAMARRRGRHGKVMLRVFVSAGGSAQSVQLRSSSRHEELDQAAMEAVRRWRFVPARQDDQPVAAWVLVPITFTLEN